MTDADINGAKYRDYVTRLKEGDKCIIQKDADAETLRRRGYVGVFRYSDLQLGDDGSIGLNIIARVADPKK